MSEKINNKSESDEKFKKRITAAALAVALGAGAGIAVAQEVHRDNTYSYSADQPLNQEQIIALQEQMSGLFQDSQQVGDQFILTEGEGYLEKSLEQVKNVYGEEIAHDAYNQLRIAATHQSIPQPNGTYVVVETDTDKHGAKNFFPVSSSQIIHNDIDELPTPTTH